MWFDELRTRVCTLPSDRILSSPLLLQAVTLYNLFISWSHSIVKLIIFLVQHFCWHLKRQLVAVWIVVLNSFSGNRTLRPNKHLHAISKLRRKRLQMYSETQKQVCLMKSLESSTCVLKVVKSLYLPGCTHVQWWQRGRQATGFWEGECYVL